MIWVKAGDKVERKKMMADFIDVDATRALIKRLAISGSDGIIVSQLIFGI